MLEENIKNISQEFRLENADYCLKCRKKTKSTNAKVVKTKNGRIMLLSKTKNGRIILLSNCAVGNNKKSKFIKEQEARRLLRSFRIRAPSSQFPLLGPFLFKTYKMNQTTIGPFLFKTYKMNETTNFY